MDDGPRKAVPLNTPPEEYYNQPDSIYIRLQYFEDTKKFRFEIKNPLLSSYDPENIPPHIFPLCAYIRGMVEMAMQQPELFASMGTKAFNFDALEDTIAGLTDAQKKLFEQDPKGNA